MKNLFLTLAATFILTGTFAQNRTLTSGDITFKSQKKDIEFTASKFESAIDLAAKTITVSLPINNFEIKSKMQKNHFSGEKGMKVSEFANATFEGTIVSEADLSTEGTHETNVTGTLTIMGVGVEITIPAIIEVSAEGIKTSATFQVNRKAHNATTNYAEMLDEDIEVIINANY